MSAICSQISKPATFLYKINYLINTSQEVQSWEFMQHQRVDQLNTLLRATINPIKEKAHNLCQLFIFQVPIRLKFNTRCENNLWIDDVKLDGRKQSIRNSGRTKIQERKIKYEDSEFVTHKIDSHVSKNYPARALSRQQIKLIRHFVQKFLP